VPCSRTRAAALVTIPPADQRTRELLDAGHAGRRYRRRKRGSRDGARRERAGKDGLARGGADADGAPGRTRSTGCAGTCSTPNRRRLGSVDDTVLLFSAPGEGREAVEVARRLLDEAARGVPFDDMAVLVRAPHTYLSLLEHALDRAGIPAWYHRGTRRPDPAGRALLALMTCAEEGLSARRFAEYVSLGQVPEEHGGAARGCGRRCGRGC
jgi:ATP-dependent helicase/nuclease subunit B